MKRFFNFGTSHPKQSKEDLKKTNQKITLNQDTTKDTYDLANCNLYILPENFSFYQIDLHLKTGLNLSNNKLSSLKEGGDYSYLSEISYLDLSFNLFKKIDVLENLFVNAFSTTSSLTILNLQENGFKTLPNCISCLKNLQDLNVSYNLLESLPNSIGELKNLQKLNLKGNSNLKKLPNELGKIGATLEEIILDEDMIKDFVHPSGQVLGDLGCQDTQTILKWLCQQGNYPYNSTKSTPKFTKQPLTTTQPIEDPAKTRIEKYLSKIEKDQNEHLRQTALAIEKDNLHLQKLTKEVEEQVEQANIEVLKALEKEDELARKLAIEAAFQREKDLENAQNAIELEQKEANKLISRILQEQDIEIPNILEKLKQYDENDAKLLSDLYQQEKSNQEDFKKIIENDLHENAEMAHYFNEYMAELEFDNLKILQNLENENKYATHQMEKAENDQKALTPKVLEKIIEDENMQKEIMSAAIKSRDAEMLRIQSDISEIEKRLKLMTLTDMNERDLMIKDIMNKERLELAKMIEILHKQMDEREVEIQETLAHINQVDKDERLNYWLYMYKNIMAEKPAELIHLESRISQIVRDVLTTADCDNYLTVFARHSILEENDLRYLNEEKLRKMGIWSVGEQNRIMAAITKYVVPVSVGVVTVDPTAPSFDDHGSDDGKDVKGTKDTNPKSTSKLANVETLPEPTYTPPPTEQPTAPKEVEIYEEKECVICLDNLPDVIFLPCGHTCTCDKCGANLKECPLCRVEISSRLKMKR